jgi:hypothetical protein
MIGSQAAPILADIFMEEVGIKVKEFLDIKKILIKLTRFVDDLLAIKPRNSKFTTEDLLEAFTRFGMGLKFTKEEPTDNTLQYLEVKIIQSETMGLCWISSQRLDKPIIPADSHIHSNIVRGNAINLLKRASLLSCHHHMEGTIVTMEKRLMNTGLSQEFVSKLLISLNFIDKRTKEERDRRKEEFRRPTAVSKHTHGFSNRSRKIANWFDVNACSHFPDNRKNLPTLFYKSIKKIRASEEEEDCKHDFKGFELCQKNVVYQLRMSCGANYDGETGKCINTRVEQHLENIEKKKLSQVDNDRYSNIAKHTNTCSDCHIVFEESSILKSNIRSGFTRKLIEGYHMSKDKTTISTPSLIPTNSEVEYMLMNKLI